MNNIIIAGTGSYVPDTVVTNQDIVNRLACLGIESSNEWIVAKTGIRERRIAADNESTSDLGCRAGMRALEHAQMASEDIGLIICATSTPDMYLPSTACLIQGRLEASNAVAMDVNAACCGFIYAVATAYYYLLSGSHDSALVIGADTYSRILNWEDRSSCVFFGDAAGAVVLRRSEEDKGIRGIHLGSDGRKAHVIKAPACGMAVSDPLISPTDITNK